MTITASILGLAKNNNGFFKSEKQSFFLISEMEKADGYVGFITSGYNSCPLFATWDEKGIIRIVKHSKTKEGCKAILTFERSVKGVLSELQLKEITYLKRKLKATEKNLKEKQTSFLDGSYNSSGDENTYTIFMIEVYNRRCSILENQILSLKTLISEKES